MTHSVDGVDRRLPRYHTNTILNQLTRHVSNPTTPQPELPKTNRETPDASQVIGIPLFIMRTPSWRRQDWAEPQTPPTSGYHPPLEDTP